VIKDGLSQNLMVSNLSHPPLLPIQQCSACSHDSSFVVRIASGNVLWLRACVCDSGKHFECRSVLEFWNRAGAGSVGDDAARHTLTIVPLPFG